MKRSDSGTFYEKIESDKQYERLTPIIDFFCDAKISIPYPICFARFHDANVFGMAAEGEILLAEKIFDSGNHFVANTIIEEIIHLRSGADDKTRAFQDASINMFIEYIKQINKLEL